MTGWRLKRVRQCPACPWRVGVDPNQIPNGYSVDKHAALERTIAKPGELNLEGPLRVMACHDEHEAHCVGWLANQLGPGNNIGLRLAVRDCANLGAISLRGEQHETFADTLPKADAGLWAKPAVRPCLECGKPLNSRQCYHCSTPCRIAGARTTTKARRP